MLRSLALLGSFIFFGVFIGLMWFSFLLLVAPVRASGDAFFNAASANLQTVLTQARQDGKQGVLVLFEMDGCGECRTLKETVLRDPAVQAYYRRHFLSVSLNLLSSAPLTDFKGKALSQSGFALANRVQASPTFIFYDASGYPVTRFTGAMKNPAEFLQLGRYVVEAAYENAPFRAYQLQHNIQ